MGKSIKVNVKKINSGDRNSKGDSNQSTEKTNSEIIIVDNFQIYAVKIFMKQ